MKINLYLKYIFSIINFFITTEILALNSELFIDKVLNNKSLFEINKINLEIKEIELKGDYDDYANWHYDFNGYFKIIQDQGYKDTDYTYTHKEYGNKKFLANNLTKKFFQSGSELQLSLDLYAKDILEEKYKQQNYLEYEKEHEYSLVLSGNWRFPFLYNNSGVLEQTEYDIAKLEFEDAKLLFRDFQEDKIAYYLEIYYGFDLISRKINLLEEYINNLQEIERYITKAKFTQKRIDYLKKHLVKANSNLAKLKLKQDELKSDLLDILTIDEIASIHSDLEVLNKIPDNNIQDNAIILKRIKIEELQNIRKIRYYENKLKPELDFVISLEKELKDASYSSYNNLNATDVEVAINFSNPYGELNVQTEVLLEKRKLNLRKLQIKYASNLKDLEKKYNLLSLELAQILKKLADIDVSIKAFDVTNNNNISEEEFKSKIVNLTNILDLKKNYLDELFNYKINLIDIKNMQALLVFDSM